MNDKWLIKAPTKIGGKHTWEYIFTVDPAVMSTYLSRVPFRIPTDEELLTSWAPKVRSTTAAMHTRMHAWHCGDCTRLRALQAKKEKEARQLQLDLFKKEKPEPTKEPITAVDTVEDGFDDGCNDGNEPSLLALSKLAHEVVEGREEKEQYVTKKDFDARWAAQDKFNKELGEIAVETNEMQRYFFKIVDHHRDPKNNPYPEKPAFLR